MFPWPVIMVVKFCVRCIFASTLYHLIVSNMTGMSQLKSVNVFETTVHLNLSLCLEYGDSMSLRIVCIRSDCTVS